LTTTRTSLLVIVALSGLSNCGPWTSAAQAQGISVWNEPFALRSLIARGQDDGSSGAQTDVRSESELRNDPENPFEDHLETDRDSFTPATTTVNRGRWIMESSYSFIDNRHAPDTNSFPELLLRYGLTERFELRIGWNYEAGGGGNVVSSVETDEGLEAPRFERESRTLYGFKWRITDQSKWIPESSVIGQGYTPTRGDATATEASVAYILGWELPKHWKLDAGIRYATSTDHGDDFAIWNASTVLRIPLSERINVHAEYFDAIPQGRAGGHSEHFFSPGVHYLLNPNLEIGVRVGWGLNEFSARFFSNAGVGWRF
jgi:hypothetical protein